MTRQRNLGDVVDALSRASVKDPIYDLEIASAALTDHEIEEFLSPEEERMNREMKTFHPVYNNMAFPDPLNRTARTVTATCTRVSRESIVIEAPEQSGRFRRLTVRERGCLQGFPITYQFYGDTYAQKLKMIGNAVPPLFTFYVAQAMLEVPPENLIEPAKGISLFDPPIEAPKKTRPETKGNTYPATRRFKAAIPHLRFKSGVRFELSNESQSADVCWRMRFFFGNSKKIIEVPLDSQLLARLDGKPELARLIEPAATAIARVQHVICSTTSDQLQARWTHTTEHGFHPYEIVDAIGQAAEVLIELLSRRKEVAIREVSGLLMELGNPIGTDKVLKHAEPILAGFLLGITVNLTFQGEAFGDLQSPETNRR